MRDRVQDAYVSTPTFSQIHRKEASVYLDCMRVAYERARGDGPPFTMRKEGMWECSRSGEGSIVLS